MFLSIKIRNSVFIALNIYMMNSAFAQSDQPNITQKLIRSWYGCIKESYGLQLKTSSDKYLSAENAFLACATEENAVLIPIQNNPDMQYKYRIIMRSKAKESLFKSQPIMAPKPQYEPDLSKLPMPRKLTEAECNSARSLQTLPGQTPEDNLIFGQILRDNGC